MALALTLVLASGLIQVSPVFSLLASTFHMTTSSFLCDGHERLLRGHPAFEALILEGEPIPWHLAGPRCTSTILGNGSRA